MSSIKLAAQIRAHSKSISLPGKGGPRGAALVLIMMFGGMFSQVASAQYEGVGRQVGREIGRNVGGGGYGSGARIGDLIGGVVGSVLTRPLDESSRAAEQAKREEERARLDQERINLNNQRRLDQAAMVGREKAIREQAYEQQKEQGRLLRATPGGVVSGTYP